MTCRDKYTPSQSIHHTYRTIKCHIHVAIRINQELSGADKAIQAPSNRAVPWTKLCVSKGERKLLHARIYVVDREKENRHHALSCTLLLLPAPKQFWVPGLFGSFLVSMERGGNSLEFGI
jgi:hypothetical protein